MKLALLTLTAIAATALLPACHDHDRRGDDRAHTTTTTMSESRTLREPASATSTTVRSY